MSSRAVFYGGFQDEARPGTSLSSSQDAPLRFVVNDMLVFADAGSSPGFGFCRERDAGESSRSRPVGACDALMV